MLHTGLSLIYAYLADTICVVATDARAASFTTAHARELSLPVVDRKSKLPIPINCGNGGRSGRDVVLEETRGCATTVLRDCNGSPSVAAGAELCGCKTVDGLSKITVEPELEEH